jgi:hypothetical protein
MIALCHWRRLVLTQMTFSKSLERYIFLVLNSQRPLIFFRESYSQGAHAAMRVHRRYCLCCSVFPPKPPSPPPLCLVRGRKGGKGWTLCFCMRVFLGLKACGLMFMYVTEKYESWISFHFIEISNSNFPMLEV